MIAPGIFEGDFERESVRVADECDTKSRVFVRHAHVRARTSDAFETAEIQAIETPPIGTHVPAELPVVDKIRRAPVSPGCNRREDLATSPDQFRPSRPHRHGADYEPFGFLFPEHLDRRFDQQESEKPRDQIGGQAESARSSAHGAARPRLPCEQPSRGDRADPPCNQHSACFRERKGPVVDRCFVESHEDQQY